MIQSYMTYMMTRTLLMYLADYIRKVLPPQELHDLVKERVEETYRHDKYINTLSTIMFVELQ